MKTVKKVLLIGVLSLFFIATSCSESEKAPCEGKAAEMSEAATTFSKALHTYSLDETTENCNALKSTGKNYIKIIKEMKGCVPASESVTLDELVTETEEYINTAC